MLETLVSSRRLRRSVTFASVRDPGFDYLNAIAEHSKGFAVASEGNLDAGVEGCPGWDVADLVWHLTEVHWFWATIVEERLKDPPAESRRPERAERDRLIEAFRRGADRLIDVLERTPDDARVWTWAPAQQHVAFIARHQVQEAAVHHWDAAHAAGRDLDIEPAVAVDSVDEFLTFSVSSDADPAEPTRPSLEGKLVLACSDADAAWSIADGEAPGTVKATEGTVARATTVTASASDLLLWLYGRVEVSVSSNAKELVERFRALTFTD